MLKCFVPALVGLLVFVLLFLRSLSPVASGIAFVSNVSASLFWLKNREAQQHFGLFPFHVLFNVSLLGMLFFLGCLFLFEDFRVFVESEWSNILFFAFGESNEPTCCSMRSTRPS